MNPDTVSELDLPDGVFKANQAVEVLRAWVADGGLHVVFDPETFRERMGEWGRLLADVAQHIANAAALDGQAVRQEALDEIKTAFDRGIAQASKSMTGAIKGRIHH